MRGRLRFCPSPPKRPRNPLRETAKTRLVLPSERMTADRAPLFNYGLKDLDALLGGKLDSASSLRRTIEPKAKSSMYVVALFEPKKAAGGRLLVDLTKIADGT